MPTYTLPAKIAIREAIDAGHVMIVHERLTAVAIQSGYVLGPGGIAIHADGSVTIDADRDPAADWEAFDPLTMLTPAEIAARQEAEQRALLAAEVSAYLETLATNETLLVNGIAALKGNNPPNTVAALRTYVTAMAEMTLDHNRGIERLIRYLVRAGVIGG